MADHNEPLWFQHDPPTCCSGSPLFIPVGAVYAFPEISQWGRDNFKTEARLSFSIFIVTPIRWLPATTNVYFDTVADISETLITPINSVSGFCWRAHDELRKLTSGSLSWSTLHNWDPRIECQSLYLYYAKSFSPGAEHLAPEMRKRRFQSTFPFAPP